MTLRMNIHMDKTFDNTTLSLRYLKNILPRYFENNKMSIVQWVFFYKYMCSSESAVLILTVSALTGVHV